MPKDLYLDCFAGVSGDMWVAALLDLGWDEESLRRGLALLGLEDEYHLHVSRQTRHHIGGVKFDVHLEHSHPHAHSHGHEHGPEHHHGDHGPGHHGHDHHHHGEAAEHTHGRNFSQIRELIEGSGLPEPVKQRAVAVFHRVAVAEGKIHGMPPEKVAFHEVGAVDSIVDIVAGCLGIHELGIERVRASRLVEGTGQISCAHGLLPLPAPATLEILTGIPLQQIEVPYEMITPTGATLLAEFSGGFGPMPTMQVERIGYGLGTRDTSPRPNVLRAVLGQFVEVNPLTTQETDRVLELQTNLDDCSPELLAAAVEHLRNAGALEVFLTPVQTKKHRPAWVLTVLSSPSQARTLAEKILEQTTSFGVRWREMDRLILQREVVDFSSSLGPVKIKLGRLGDRLLQVAPEFDAVEQLARQSSQPLRAIWARVEAEARLHFSN